MRIFALAAVAVALAALADGVQAAAPASTPHPIVYEISTRPWLYNMTQKYGRQITQLSQVPKQEYQAIADMGVQVVWMMGVWQLGAYGLHHDRTEPSLLADYAKELPGYTQADIIGSPYAIFNYTLNPQLGKNGDLAALRDMLHGMGMQLMLDFVPNHTAVDNPWTTEHPKYYVLGDSSCPSSTCVNWHGNYIYFGGDYYNHGWTDTAQLNYWNPAVVSAQIDNLLTIASYADAIRCDMAHDILNAEISKTWGSILTAAGWKQPAQEFWGVAIAAVHKEFPNVRFLGETYNYGFTHPLPEDLTLRKLGFAFTYDQPLLGKLQANNLDNLRGYVSGEGGSFFAQACNYVSNHDNNRAAGKILGSLPAADAGAAVISTLPGMRLYFQGQFLGLHNTLDVHLRRSAPEPIHANVTTYYNKLLHIVGAPVFQTGTFAYSDVQNSGDAWRLVAWRWFDSSQRRLCVVNYSNQQGSGAIVTPNAAGSGNITVTEMISGDTYTRSAPAMRSTGLFVVVPPYSAQIFSY
eukprot:PLAT618.1.p1 GENE.PLAT618.1~~PLAT618.1.p1  ORF type:complete len:521 (-),score=233.06 PLAT618.1:123-1685(-)